ncbi:piggyBac transposable element-derived protein 2-like [Saccostrea echinata]|uniref:piggyBac transposable element-derived protein 2-like n=1 Tax=Saccostrea echinata TaxID=191078 RepID=UPI002A81A06C|nr:piggyBac transposable element-derived protein 2-like [Saccostrea echinata]
MERKNKASSECDTSDYENETLFQLKKKLKTKTLTPVEDSDSESENIPLSAYIREKKPDRSNNEAPLRELNFQDITEDPDLLNVLPQLPNQEWNWSNQQFKEPCTEFKGKLEEAPHDGLLKTPFQFFKLMVTDQIISNISEQTNLYAMQKEGIQLSSTKKEIEIMIGVYLRIGLVQMPRVRAYWETESRFPPIADAIARNRFEKIATMIHLTNNMSVTDEQKKDKLWKVRPWIEQLRNRFLEIPPEENHAVDELMVSFKGKSSLKQYIRDKPNPWGFKLWGRAGASSILYDFDVYQGSFEKNANSIGVGGDVVLKLVSTLEPNNYKIFADNYFTSPSLVKALKERSFWYVGTVRSNRLRGCTLKSEKELKKEGRGSVDYRVETSCNIIALRWYDNKSVDVVSSYVGLNPVGEVRRWDK